MPKKDYLASLVESHHALALDPQDANAILADAERALKRAKRLREALPAEYERVDMVQGKGPTISFAGKLLAETTWGTRGDDPMNVTLELYETPAGNWIAATIIEPLEREGYESLTARVIERREDVLAMRMEVLEAFQWHERARSMLKKAGWPPVIVEVE